jgi:hypothetical protein
VAAAVVGTDILETGFGGRAWRMDAFRCASLLEPLVLVLVRLGVSPAADEMDEIKAAMSFASAGSEVIACGWGTS